MIYHFNDVDENGDVIVSVKIEDRNNIPSQKIISLSCDKKLSYLSLSEKYKTIKDADTNIMSVVFPFKSTCCLALFILSFIAFLYIGAACFSAIEIKREQFDRERFRQIRKDFLKDNRCLKDKSVENFIKEIETLTNRGVSPKANASTSNYNWNIPNAVFFATTLVTTIGYGNDKPVTVGGKIFCILFVIIGVPLMMFLTSAVVERLYYLVDLVFSAIFFHLNCTVTEAQYRLIQIFVCFGMLIVLFICMPALIFSKTDKWTYIDAVYYCIISLTTIGLGDFVPGDSSSKLDRDTTLILSTVYLFCGLLWASYSIRVFHRYGHGNILAKYIYLGNLDFPDDSVIPINQHHSQYNTNYNLTYGSPSSSTSHLISDHLLDASNEHHEDGGLHDSKMKRSYSVA